MPLYHFCRTILFFLFKVFCGLEVSGRENLPKKGAFILASNHTSNLDPMILGVASFRELNFMAKEDLFRNFLFGCLLKNVGAFPLKRDTVDISAIKEAINRLKKGAVLVIFPEGSRRKENNAQAQSGIGMLSSKAGCPVLPAFVSGADKVMPPGSKFIFPAKIRVKFGKPLNFDHKESYEFIADKVMQEILALK